MLALPSAFLTLPAPGDPTFPAIVRKVRLLVLRRLLGAPVGGPPGLLRGVGALREALADAARRDKGATLELLGQLDAWTPILCWEAGLVDGAAALAAAGPSLLAGLAARGLMARPVMWEHPVSSISVAGRLWRFAPPARALAALPAGAEVQLLDGRRLPLAELPGAPDLHPLPSGVQLSTFDSNPLAMQEAHPDKQGNRIDLGGYAVEDWQAALGEALELVEAGLPEWHRELPLSLQRIVPVGFLPEVHLSASYREAPGLAYLTLHGSRLTLAEAIVHEAQHSRLNLLTWLDPVLENGFTEWTASPVRPDLRPVMGVLLAVHAFVPVAALHARLAEQGRVAGPDLDRRRAQVLSGNARGLEILRERARPTPTGRRLLAELQALHDHLAALAPPPPPDAEPRLPC